MTRSRLTSWRATSTSGSGGSVATRITAGGAAFASFGKAFWNTFTLPPSSRRRRPAGSLRSVAPPAFSLTPADDGQPRIGEVAVVAVPDRHHGRQSHAVMP